MKVYLYFGKVKSRFQTVLVNLLWTDWYHTARNANFPGFLSPYWGFGISCAYSGDFILNFLKTDWEQFQPVEDVLPKKRSHT